MLCACFQLTAVFVCGLEHYLHSRCKLSVDIWRFVGLLFCGSVIENTCGIVEFFLSIFAILFLCLWSNKHEH